MAHIQEVTPDAADNSGPIFDTKPLQKVQNDNDNYNVFTNDREHLEQPESVNDTYLEEQGDTNITTDSLDMSTNGEMVDHDDLSSRRDGDKEIIRRGKVPGDSRSYVESLGWMLDETHIDDGAESELRNPEVVEGAAVAIPIEAVEEVSSRFANTLYGYFIGNRLAFPLVENYVKNTWAKYGLKRIQLHEEFFMFQFNTKEGMESVMEAGPWLIRRVPLILNVWTPNTDLKKDVIKVAPLWVKLHHVPIVAYSEIGLSLITTQLGRPIMLDSYTSNMCLSSWGRNTYARTLIEFSAKVELKESIVIAIPLSEGKGHTLAQIDVEYEWTPPKCEACESSKKNDMNVNFNQGLQVNKINKSNAIAASTVNKINMSNANDASTVNNVTIKNSFGVLTDDEEMGSKSNTIINEDS
ncbi:zinc knuckle CX2CX4HX4C containing protein, partial [Tanacetum coccineum]